MTSALKPDGQPEPYDVPFLKEPRPRPYWWKRGLEYDIERIALSGNTLRGLISGLLSIVAVAVVIGLVSVLAHPDYAPSVLTFTGVLAGGLLAVTAAFINVYLSASVEHAGILRRDFFERVATCKVKTNSVGAACVVVGRAVQSAGPSLPSEWLEERIDQLGVFRYAYGHFDQYMGVRQAWNELADAVNSFNRDQRARVEFLQGLVRERMEGLGLGLLETDESAGSIPAPGFYRSIVAAWLIATVLTVHDQGRQSPLSGEDRLEPIEQWRPLVRVDTEQRPPLILVNPWPFTSGSSSGAPTVGGLQRILSEVAVSASRNEHFSTRKAALEGLRTKTDALRRAATLASAHIEAARWIQGSCDVGL
jgi:hypothetical protein